MLGVRDQGKIGPRLEKRIEMSQVSVWARVPEDLWAMAGIHQGLPPSTPKSGIIRMALAVFHGQRPNEARMLAQAMTGNNQSLDAVEVPNFACKLPDELADLADTPDGMPRSMAVRIGMAMLAGYSRERAEAYARMQENYGQHGGDRRSEKFRQEAAK